MKRALSAVLALVLVATAAPVAAQSFNFGVGGGGTLPLGDFNDIAKLGWHGMGIVGYSMPSGLGIRGEFFYGQNSLDNVDGKTKLAGGLGSINYTFQTQSGIKPYVIGSVGVMNAKVEVGSASADETKLTFGGGAGLKFKAGSDSNIFVESRYLTVNTSGSNTNFIPLTIGISFGTK